MQDKIIDGHIERDYSRVVVQSDTGLNVAWFRGKGSLQIETKFFRVITFILFILMSVVSSRMTIFPPIGHEGSTNGLMMMCCGLCSHQISTQLNTYRRFWTNTRHDSFERMVFVPPVERQRLEESMPSCTDADLAFFGSAHYSCLHFLSDTEHFVVYAQSGEAAEERVKPSEAKVIVKLWLGG